MPTSYLLEVTLDTGQHLQSALLEYTSDVFDYLSSASAVDHARKLTMVEAVAVIDTKTGEVVIDVPSFTCLARCPTSQDGWAARAWTQVPKISYGSRA